MSSGNPETRTKILEATWALLEDPKGGDARMSDIAKAAGVSRQALYLHFPARADLLIATTHHIDEVKDVNGRLEKSRKAATGRKRLNAFIEAWGNYIPEIQGVARALLALRATDEAARSAWDDRMRALKHGCDAAVQALKRDGELSGTFTAAEATDLLWTLLSVENWQQLTQQCQWSQKRYIVKMKAAAARLLIDRAA